MHYLNPKVRRAHVLVCYRNFKAHQPHCSHVGLGVNAINTVRVLRSLRIQADLVAVWEHTGLRAALKLAQYATVSHCIVEAPFISLDHFTALLREFPNVQFISRIHSNVGFLQVEAGAIALFRQYLTLQDDELNFELASNSKELCAFIEETYIGRCLLLPNLYYMDRTARRPAYANPHAVRIASFGSIRLQKNHSTAAAAALLLAHRDRLQLEFFLTVSREEHGKGVLQAIRNLFHNLHWAKLIEVPWSCWGEFRRTVGHMDLCYQLSMSETFNLVSADAVAEGVPVVGSDVIEWLPANSIVCIDDVEEAATVGAHLLRDPRAAQHQMHALAKFQQQAAREWVAYLANQIRKGDNETRFVSEDLNQELEE